MQSQFVAWYNFGRKPEALRGVTLAMASRSADHVRTIEEHFEHAALAG